MSENKKVKQIMALLDKLTQEEKELFDEFWEWDKWDKWEKKNESIPYGVMPLYVDYAQDINRSETMASLLPYVQPTEPIDPNSDKSLYSFTGVFRKEVK